MACLCDHTMQQISNGMPVYWCPRCGTIKSSFGVPEYTSPSIVERAHAFMKYAMVDESDPFVKSIARSLAECIV